MATGLGLCGVSRRSADRSMECCRHLGLALPEVDGESSLISTELERHRDRTERWFIRRGLPHLIDHYSVREDVLTRMFPFLAFVVFLELFLAFGDRWEGWGQAAVFIGCVALGVVAFALINRVRGRRLVQLPDRVGVLEIVLYLVLPVVPTAVGSQNAVAENVFVVVVLNVLILLVAFVVTSWGLLPMIRWSIGQLRAQIGDIANLTMKSLPILLIFSAFIFLNAEMWQVANDFTLPYFAAVVVLVVFIGSGFVMLSVRRLTVDLARFERWSDVRRRSADTPVDLMVPSDEDPAPDAPRLHRRAEYNVALLLFASQAIQILLVALVITVFYVLFGLLTVREDTLLQWTTATELTSSVDWASRWSFLGSEMVFTRQLVLVSAFIGLMSGLQFAVQIVTDAAYREEFAEDMTSEIRQALAVRAVYYRRLVPDGPL